MSPPSPGGPTLSWHNPTRVDGPEQPLRFAIGEVLGNHRIERLIATGGMGTLYEARHVEIGQRVAIKVLSPRWSQDPDMVRRFFDEARAANKIDNEHIVQIHDVVQGPNGLSYLVMELLEGFDLLAARTREGPLSMERLKRISLETAEALQAAHAKRIIHRDLKPENIFLRNGGKPGEFVKLLDFGVAKLLETAGHQTQAGLVMGTPEFMAPEQALGARVDARADVYAFGVVLHWMVSGRLPFSGEELAELDRRRKGPPPLAEVSESGEPVPEAMRDLVSACLRYDSRLRLATMDEVIAGLRGSRSDSHAARQVMDPVATAEARWSGSPTVRDRVNTPVESPKTPVGVSSWGLTLWALGLAGALAVVGVLGWQVLFAAPPGSVPELPPPRPRPVAALPALSPDPPPFEKPELPAPPPTPPTPEKPSSKAAAIAAPAPKRTPKPKVKPRPHGDTSQILPVE